MTQDRVKLLVCLGLRCDAEGRGSALLERVREALPAAFPEDWASGRLALDTRDCFRLCTRDPVVRIDPAGEAFSNPDPDDLLQEIARALEPQKQKGPGLRPGQVGSEDGR